MKKSFYFYTSIALTIILGLIIGNYIFGWTTPEANPPSSNLAAPINTGSTAQSKSGYLAVGTTTTPTYPLEVGNQLRVWGQLISKVASGTTPFVVDSPTLVQNLNADELDGYDALDLIAGGGGGTCDGTQLHIKFTTSTHPGNLGGKSAGDDICNTQYSGYTMCTKTELDAAGATGCLPPWVQYLGTSLDGWIWTGANNYTDCYNFTCAMNVTNGVSCVTGSTSTNAVSFRFIGNNWGYGTTGCGGKSSIACCK